ncbi:hypothetical protein DQ04_06351010 [Trypanosoma grayi]|uniref:hypothetical protein n=1 Tax=Trypanosoma grayi TaxID=71804 RepID=UPI0004F46DEF|nr:hypothetical protein DQ04_06351010 [Trypanosoma grayi]KEG08834.1 hypothetical protein DQ04_06351010 [Trypanosoma grayi]
MVAVRRMNTAVGGGGGGGSGGEGQRDTARLLQRLVWRAKESLLAGAANMPAAPQPRLVDKDTAGLFRLEWSATRRSSQKGRREGGHSVGASPAPTPDEGMTLLCELLAVALKSRKGAAVADFLSSDAASVVSLPLMAAEAVVAPLGRQARLWGELQEWHGLLTCAAAAFERAGRRCENEEMRRGVVRAFVDKLEALSVPAESDTAHGRRRRHKEVEKESRSIVDDTLPNTLWRLAMLYRVIEGLLLQAKGESSPLVATEGDGGAVMNGAEEQEKIRSPLAEIVGCMVCELEDRVYRVRHPDGHVEPLESLEALVIKAFHHCCSLERDGGRPRAYKGDLANALLSFCGAYFKVIPTCLSALSNGAAAGSGSSPNVAVVRAIRQCWLQQQTSVPLHGIRGAFWWLQLVPVLLESLLDTTAQLERRQSSSSSSGRGSSSPLETMQAELINLLSAMLYFDTKAFEERRAALAVSHATGDAGGEEMSEDNDAQPRRPRGGRSMFKKGDENGVLLPSAADASRKSSRFSSRRVWGAGGDTGSASAALETMGVEANSPLFDVIAASKDAVSQLANLYAVDIFHRGCALEGMWLVLLEAHRHVLQGCASKQVDVRPDVGRACVTTHRDMSRLMLPPFVAASLRHLADTLASAVHRVYELADPVYVRDGNIRRSVGAIIVAGTQGTLLQNRFYADALASNWWMRSGAPFLLPRGPRPSVALERSLMNLLVQRVRQQDDTDWLKQSTAVVFSCLSAAAEPTGHSLCLSPMAKQWAGALVLANLRAAAYLLKGGAGGGINNNNNNNNADGGHVVAGSGGSGKLSEEEAKGLLEWACSTFSSLLAALTADEELLLMCGYASFIDALFEVHLRLGTPQKELMQFGDKTLLKTNLSAVLASLAKSADEDDAETHAATCESALFVLAELSRFASWSNIKLTAVLRTDDNDLLIRVAVYCLRHVPRGGGKRASGYGMPAAELPVVEPPLDTASSSATVAFLLARGNRRSYLQVLDLSNRLLPFSRVQPLYGGREGSSMAALQHYLRGVSRVSSSSSEYKQLVDESVRCFGFMANTSISAHVLGYLVRFIEHYLREQERLSRTPLEASTSTTASSEQRKSAMSSLARVGTAPLVLLDYMGYLSSAGSWTMVTWAFNLAETALKIQRKHQVATTTSVGDVATTAILSQLRALSLPTTPQLPHNMLKSILCLSDIMSESPVTLLGFDRGTPLQGLLRHASRGEYRTMFFAVKQAVVLVQRTSVRYRGPQPHRTEGDASDARGEDDGKERMESDGGLEEGAYFMSAAEVHLPEEKRRLRVFLDCLVACFDNVLDAIRWCALQQDALDDELREVLVLALHTLIRVLQGCIRAVLQVPATLRERYRAERAHMLWVSLCVASLLGKVVAADYTRVCFTGNLRRSTDVLLGTIEELLEECSTPKSKKKTNNSSSSSSSTTPLLETLTESVQYIYSDAQVSHRLAIRLGLGVRQRTDLTALITALRAFAAASAKYQPAGLLVQRAWRTLCEEILQTQEPRGRRGKSAATVNVVSLRVPSKEELRLLLESFHDLEREMTESVSMRKAQRRPADYVVAWACEDAAEVVNRVTEDPSLLYATHTRDAALDDGEEQQPPGLGAGTTVAIAEPHTAAFMEMDAAVLLEEEVENLTNSEAIEALIRQCRRVQMSSSAVVNIDTALAIPQTAKVITTHFDCVVAIFTRCTLAEIVAFPCAEFVFSSLDLFSRRRTLVPLEKCRALWAQLAAKWKAEFLDPDGAHFEQQQRELLQLVRQRRSLLELADKDAGDATGPISLFSLQENTMAQLAQRDAAPIPYDVDLPCHDDVSGLVAGRKGEGKSRAKKQQQQQQQQAPRESLLQQRVPLDVLLTMLADLPRGPRGEPELENLARVTATYVARQHVLLRRRNSGDVANVMQFLQPANQQSPRVYQRRRLPLDSVHAAAAAGWFLGPQDRKAFAAALDCVGDATLLARSAEEGVFEYVRSSCLYLHVLSLTAHVCHHFRMFGGSSNDSGDVARSNRHGFDEDGAETTAWWAMRSEQAEARLAERRMRADTRQTDADSVNANLLESILLHYLNVSWALMRHTDFVTHRATSIAMAADSGHDRVRDALLYADELRLMVAVTVQDTTRILLREAPPGFSLARRVVHRIISSFSCEIIPTASQSGAAAITGSSKKRGSSSDVPSVNMVVLEAWRVKRPELFVRSPTLLCVLSPSFFNDVLSQHIRNALSLTLAQVVASLHFYLRRPDAHLAPLMEATTSILSSTYVRNAALRLFCEELCAQILERDSFCDALAPPTVASVQQGAAGSVPNEVLIPFLASICREDACVSKNTLATVLYRAMSLRPDVFGQPPTADRFSRLAIARKSGGSNPAPAGACAAGVPGTRAGAAAGEGSVKGRLSLGLSSTDVVLESPLVANGGGVTAADGEAEAAVVDALSAAAAAAAVGDEEHDEVEALNRFKADQADETATRTHKSALASLNLTLAEVMETAMHFAAMRQLTAEEHKKATAMLRAADDARHERVATFRSAAPTVAARKDTDVETSSISAPTAGHPDASLQIEEPMHFGVVMLHIRFALRKIIHVSMRRLAPQQGPKTLSMMVEMLQEVDPKWHRGHGNEHRRQSDGMLAGTLRVLLARSVVCVELAGDAGDLLGGGAGGIAMSAAGLQRMERALHLVQRAKHHSGGGGGAKGHSRRRGGSAAPPAVRRGSAG